MAVFLGIDAGTTNIKAVLLSEDGELLERTDSPVTVRRPFEGACETDMGELWRILCGLCRRLEAKNPSAWAKLEGVAVTGQGDGLWPVNKDGEPAGPAILWNDTRAHAFGDVDLGEVDCFLQTRSSQALFPGALPLILKWLHVNQRDVFDGIHTALHCKDWLNYKLTGVLYSDYSDYSTAGIDIFSKEHVLELYDMLGIPGAKKMLPPLAPSTQLIGKVTRWASTICGIPEGVPVAAGAIDIVATSMGAGVVHRGDGCTILGTTLGNNILLDQEQVNLADRAGSTLCSILPGKYVRLMAALSGNSTIDWAKSMLAADLSFPELERQLESVPPGSRGILYHPYVSGERAPFRDAFACGGFYGLTARHTRFDMMRAAYEGMALSVMDCHNSLPPGGGRLYLAGGGAVSDFTCRLVASALDRQVVRQKRKELAARGIVEALKLGLGLEGAALCQEEDVFEPLPRETAAFRELYKQYVELRGNMAVYWSQRRVFSEST